MYVFDYIKENISCFEFVLTKKCNYQCSYCFVEQDNKYDMSFEMMSDIFSSYKKENKKYDIMFFGGEPLLKKDIILLFLQKYFNDCNKYTLITNGSLLTEEFIKECMKYKNVYIQISIDGPEDIHNKYRIDKNNMGTFKQTMDGIQLLKKLNYPNWGLHSTCSEFHIPYMYDILDLLLKEKGSNNNDIFSMFSNMQIIHDCDSYTEETLKQFEENAIKIFTKYPQIKEQMKRRPHRIYCSAGNSLFTFWNTGDISPCHRFYYTNKSSTKIGNFIDGYYDENLLRVLSKKNRDSFYGLKSCKECNNFYCYSCPLANYHNTNDYYITPAIYCWFKQETYKILNKLVNY